MLNYLQSCQVFIEVVEPVLIAKFLVSGSKVVFDIFNCVISRTLFVLVTIMWRHIV